MFQVIITDHVEPPAALEVRELASIAQVNCLLAPNTAALVGRVEDADALIIFHEVTITKEIIAGLRKCRVIVRGGVGYDNVDLKAAGDRGIFVCNVPDYGVDEVADHAVMLTLACNRGMARSERTLRRSLVPWGFQAIEPVQRLAGKTMGIVGFGRIGSATALRAKAMRMRVIAYDPYLRPGLEKSFGVELVDLDTLLAQSDVVSLHTPLTDETRGLINARTLSKMKRTALLVNTARGAMVDTAALAEALTAGTISGAGIDVLPHEPATTSEPLIRLWQQDDPVINLIVTPHTAFFSDAGAEEMRSKAAQEVARVLRGEAPKNCVNREFLNQARQIEA